MYEEHDYRNNVLNGLITSPEERNYSDDEQYFQAILPFFIYCDQVWGENLDVIDTQCLKTEKNRPVGKNRVFFLKIA